MQSKIRNEDIQNIYKLSPMQEGMLFHYLYDRNSGAYNVQMVMTVSGNMEAEYMRKAYQSLIARHDALRTSIVYDRIKAPRQVVLKEREGDFYYEDVSALENEQKEKYISDFILSDWNRGFDLVKDILFRISLLKIDDGLYKCIVTNHHIIMDGWCLGILFNDLLHFYNCIKNNKPGQVTNIFPYSHYIKWLENQDRDAALEYWKEYLKGYDTVATLPHKNISDIKKDYRYGEHIIHITGELTAGLMQMARKNGVTLNNILQIVWGIILLRYNNTDDVIFGNVISGRPPEIRGIETMVGLFVNTIPVRITTYEKQSVLNLIKSTRMSLVQSEKFGYVPLNDIQKHSLIHRKLFDTLYSFENFPIDENIKYTQLDRDMGFTITDVKGKDQTNYDFNIYIGYSEKTKELTIRLPYNMNVIHTDMVREIGNNMCRVIEQIVDNPEKEVSEIEIITEDERYKIMEEWNATACVFPQNETLNGIFEEQVKKTPDQTAVILGERRLTYMELNKKCNKLALLLRQNNCYPDAIIAILTERSFEMITGILGILKAGCAYVPIDPHYPRDRIEYILNDSGTGVVLTQTRYLKKFSFNKKIILLDDETVYPASDSNPPVINKPGDLAYVIYTSGSTGNPKGVQIEHRSIVNTLYSMEKLYPVGPDDAYLLKTAYTFDVSITELFGWFFGQGKMVILEPDKEKYPDEIADTIHKHRVTHVNFIPSLLNVMLAGLSEEGKNKFKCLKYIMVAGEAFTIQLADELKKLKTDACIENIYGPTEASIYSTKFSINKEENYHFISIGRPMPNTKIFIVNKYDKLQPIGVPGEMCIAGTGLARGYLNRIHLTAEKFVRNPFQPGTLMYRTGDLCRWLPDGNIEFLGRLDHQVKVRGYRIELGEIESQLLKYNGIQDTVVVIHEDENANRTLAAYIIGDKNIQANELRSYLESILPSYMVPAYFIHLDSFPLTGTGKIDRKRLPAPASLFKREAEYEAPVTEIEETLVHVWEEVLGIVGIGINDNFFQIGGDSIKSIQISSQLQKYGFKLNVADIFENPTIRALAPLIVSTTDKIDQGVVTGTIKFIPIQKWFMESKISNKHHFNQSVLLHSKNRIDHNAVIRVFETIVEHHDALRIVLSGNDDFLVNKDVNDIAIDLPVFDVTGDIPGCIKQEGTRLQGSINLHNGPLVKSALFKTNEGDYLLIVIHHFVIDGISWRILLKDFITGYYQAISGNKIQLQEKTHSFKKWSQVVEEYSHSSLLKTEIPYWKDICNKARHLPLDSEIKNRYVKDFSLCRIEFDENETRDLLVNTNRAYNTTINDILISALSLAFKEWKGVFSIALTMEGHGRERITGDISVNRTIGWFTIQYPLVIDARQNLDVHIKMIKETVHGVPNKGMGFGVLRYLSDLKDDERILLNIKPDICFNYLGQFDAVDENGSFSFSSYDPGDNRSREGELLYSLDINGMIMNDRLSLSIGYCRNEYTPDEIENFCKLFKKCLLDITTHCRKIEKTVFTPCDFGAGGLGFPDLEKINASIKDDEVIENIFNLTPMQEGMLFHYLYNQDQSTYVNQIVLRITGNVKLDLLKESYRLLIEKYEALRTAIVYKDLMKPRQVIVNRRKEDFHLTSVPHIDEHAKDDYIAQYIEKDWDRGFDLTNDTLFRINVIDYKDENCFVLIITSHHIILDGWSMGLLFKELLTTYHQLQLGNVIQNQNKNLFSNYLRFLEKQDKETALLYWQEYLKDYSIKELCPSKDKKNTPYLKKTMEIHIPMAETEKIKRLGKNLEVTINNLLQAVLGIILSNYLDTDDVIFGNVISGRHNEIQGIEEMIGIFINTIPLRIKKANKQTVSELIRHIHKEFIESEKNGHIALTSIQNIIAGEKALFDLLFIYENYPVDEGIKNDSYVIDSGLQVTDVLVNDETNYNLNFIVFPGEELTIRLSYNGNVISTGFVKQMGEHAERLLREIAEHPGKRIDEIEVFTEAGMKEMLKAQGTVGRRFYRAGEYCTLKEIEEAVLNHPDISDGYAGFKEGTPVVYYVSRKEISSYELESFLKMKLGRGYFPMTYVSVEILPRTGEGKISISQLQTESPVDSGEVKNLVTRCLETEGVEDCAVYQSYETKHKRITVKRYKREGKRLTEEEIGEVVKKRPPAVSDGGELKIGEEESRTLIEGFKKTVERKGEKGIHYIDAEGKGERFRSYKELYRLAKEAGGGLLKNGYRPREKVILQIKELEEYFPVFWGCVLAGIIPVTIAVAPTYNEKGAVVNKLYNTWKLLECPGIVCSEEIKEEVKKIKELYEDIEELEVTGTGSLKGQGELEEVYEGKAGDTVFFQLSSGSTGVPKCITETHEGIIRHIIHSKEYNGYTSEDIDLNWLPVDHVVPLLTCHLKDVYLGCEQIEVKTESILTEPLLWLELIERYRVTHSWAPNFGYNLVNKELQKNREKRYDLSSMKYFMNAGEQVTLPVVREFIELTEGFGLAKHAMQPAFGMAEVCTCMTYTNDFDITDKCVHRIKKWSLGGDLIKAEEGDEEEVVEFIDLGYPVKGVMIRITDEKNEVVKEGRIGRFQIKGGKLVTPGYYRNEEANKEAFVGGGWFNTGDLGFILDGRLTLTGRAKEMIIINGVNYYCYEIEDVINNVEGVERTYAGAVSIKDEGKGTESFAVFYSPVDYEEDLRRLGNEIKKELSKKMGITPGVVLPLRKEEFPKTTSGKIQRMKMK
ncbi:MAG: amino acid adenylation domain-containing protein, partial [Spirochaetales bacterium]|nr:amino acid adenylation domain-containing protein [Spirochaetales bacterium]